MKLIIPVESIIQNKGGVILYDVDSNKILKQYVHKKKWKRCGWRGGKLYGNFLIATDWNDLHYFNVNTWQYEKTFKKSTFNDLHYVEVFDEKLYIVNTGLDAIEIFDNPLNPIFNDIIFIFNVNPKLFEKRNIDLKKNYNQKLKVKPHSAHPNCISFNGTDIFVTCFGKNQERNSGEIIKLNSGEKCTEKSIDCHDGQFYNGKFYTTLTRYAKLLEFESLNNSIPKRQISIGPKRCWWRGMVIQNDTAYIFISDGYSGKKTTTRLSIINLKTERYKIQKLPEIDGVYWDTIYQPNILEE